MIYGTHHKCQWKQILTSTTTTNTTSTNTREGSLQRIINRPNIVTNIDIHLPSPPQRMPADHHFYIFYGESP